MRADEKLPNDFYDWLEECPVVWTRGKVGNETVGYFFHCNDELWDTEPEFIEEIEGGA